MLARNLLIVLVCLIGILFLGYIVHGRANPTSNCGVVGGALETPDARDIWQRVNLFLVEEINTLSFSELEALELVKYKLMSPPDNLQVCFQSEKIIVSGSTQVLGIKTKFWAQGTVSFEGVNPQIKDLEIILGKWGGLPGLKQLVTKFLKIKLNRRLKTIFVGYPYKTVITDDNITISRL